MSKKTGFVTALPVRIVTSMNAEKFAQKRTLSTRRFLSERVAWLTTPLLPDDYLGLVNPLWSTRELRGRVESVWPETRDAVTLVIRPGSGWRGHRAGQNIRIGVDIDGVRHWRSYSLSSAPERADGCITITVKAVPEGLVSPFLVRRITPGAIVRLTRAAGDFFLPRTLRSGLLFLTAGSGITPVMGMLRSLAACGAMPDVVLVHSAPTRDEVIFGVELRGLAERFPSLRLAERHTRAGAAGSHTGRLTMAQLPVICPDWPEREVWACGPPEMLDGVEAHWQQAGVADRLHVEYFRPARVSYGGTGGRVRFARSQRETDTDGSMPLLTVGEDAGVLVPSGCRMGICYSCMARLMSGRVRDLGTGREHGDEGELIQMCVSAAAGDVEIDL
jgi:ferredoxin-NADP reductase